ncbi:exosome complex component RRP43-like [Paramacrobiotus metropolitanus]|uniref:exosome complex component RRP43-like n=1 Tax=Paramacrobiotus metropolitanus TaxID=2943436 RepID=UPI002445F150|nr:exosome complex component RRP43-like [Paramacrobiotus metropolitanus]
MSPKEPLRILRRKELIRAELTTGTRSDGRGPIEFPRTAVSEMKCSNPEDILTVARVGRTCVSCFLQLSLRTPDPSMELIKLRLFGMDETEAQPLADGGDEDSDDEIEIDNSEDRPSLSLQREAILENLFEEFSVINEASLNVFPSKFVFHLNINLHVLQEDGSVLDACSLALMAALQRLRFPKVAYIEEEEAVRYDWDDLTSPQNPGAPEFFSTFAVIGDHILACPTAEEERASDAVIAVIVQEDSSVSFMEVTDGILPSKDGSFIADLLSPLIDNAVARRKELRTVLLNPAAEDTLIPNEYAVRLRSLHLGTD